MRQNQEGVCRPCSSTPTAPLTAFHPAEAYHQDYATLSPHLSYIIAHELPKITNLKRLMPEVYREKPVRR